MPALRVDRRLAAILAADVVGYSRLIERDEAGTLERLKTLRKVLIEPILASHDGRIVKLMGDGALVEFPSATEAVAAAVEIQQATADHERNRPEAEQIRFRVGINLGDVVHEDGDIFGEGVNLAARLQALSEPGGICVSRNVYEQARNRLPVAFTFMGSRRVKNIAEPVDVWRVVPEGSPAQARGSRTMWLRPAMAAAALLRATLAGLAGSPRQWGARDGNASARPMAADPVLAMPTGPTIAVLPFANMSGDADREYLADGMTEEIITALSRFREVHVLARNATSEFKGKAVTSDESAENSEPSGSSMEACDG
jgi:class 3 adenylate cyclase